MPIYRITVLCFAASYAVALAFEVLQLFRPRHVQRWLITIFAAAGLLAHTLYFIGQRLTLTSRTGSLLFLAWVLGMFYLYGSVHYRRLAWGVFVLPVVLGVTVLGGIVHEPESGEGAALASGFEFERFWRSLHITLFVLAAVGICVAFMASLMYLVQARRLRAKTLPSKGTRLLSLERLEAMNRRGINWAFPLLTLGLIVGLMLLAQESARLQGWTDPRILSTALLWLVFAILIYLRHGYQLRGRRVAFLTIMAFALLLVSLATSHSLAPGGQP